MMQIQASTACKPHGDDSRNVDAGSPLLGTMMVAVDDLDQRDGYWHPRDCRPVRLSSTTGDTVLRDHPLAAKGSWGYGIHALTS